jgi:hypothetical protein
MEESNPKKKESSWKKYAMLAGALFVALIFVSSYTSSSNSPGTTTTTKPPNTYLAIGNAQATITGYGKDAHMSVSNQSNAVAASVSNTLLALESNGSISNYYHTGGGYQVALSGMDAYSFQQRIRNATSLQQLNVTSTAYLLLPANAMLYVNTYPVNVNMTKRNFSVSLAGIRPVGTSMNISVIAFITANGVIYNNELRINYT